METKEAKRILCQLWHIERRTVEIQQRIEAARAGALKATASVNAANGSGTATRSKVETGVVETIDLEQQLAKIYAKLVHKRHRIQTAIESMDDEQEKRLLELRYIDHLSWNAVMFRLSVSRTQSFRLHENALKHFEIAYKRV